MATSVRPAVVEPEGKPSDSAFQMRREVESVGKQDAIRCLLGALESFLAGQNLSRAEFAERICGMSESYFSKVVNGQQGDFFGLVFKLPADIRKDFLERLIELERADPVARAAEQLAVACLRFLRINGGPSSEMPARASAMAKAELPTERKKATA